MKKIVLIRHGESIWNQENRFTGWADIDLTNKGVDEAKAAGKLLLQEGFSFSLAFTSYLKRANKTLNIVLDEMNLDWVTVHKTWHLNGRHYGALEGLNKVEMVEKYGEDQVKLWRRSFNTPPPLLDKNDERSPLIDDKYKDLNPKDIPLGESLEQASLRILPYWNRVIVQALAQHNEIIVAAHGNTLRAIVKHVKGFSDEEILSINIPTATPYVFEFDDELVYQKDYYLGDEASIEAEMNKVANQAG